MRLRDLRAKAEKWFRESFRQRLWRALNYYARSAASFEFIIPQRPVSQQTRRRARLRDWRDFVADHARAAFGNRPLLTDTALAIRLLYFYEEAALDADNIVKPIQDALVNVIFPDDSLITDIEVRRRWLRTSFAIGDVSPTLATGLDLKREFIYVVIDQAPPQDVLP